MTPRDRRCSSPKSKSPYCQIPSNITKAGTREGEYAYFFTNPYPPKDPTPPPPATPTYSTSARLDDVTSFNPPAEFIPPSATLSDPTSFDFPSAPAHDDASDVPTATRTRPDSYNPPGAWTGKEDDSDEE